MCSFKGDVSSRPSWAGGALSWGLNLASFEGVPIQLTGFEMEHIQMLRSVFLKHIIGLIQVQNMSACLFMLHEYTCCRSLYSFKILQPNAPAGP